LIGAKRPGTVRSDIYWAECFDALEEFDTWPSDIDVSEPAPVRPVGMERAGLNAFIDSVQARWAREDAAQLDRLPYFLRRTPSQAMEQWRERAAQQRAQRAWMERAARPLQIEPRAPALPLREPLCNQLVLQRERWRTGGFRLFDRHARSLERVRRWREAHA